MQQHKLWDLAGAIPDAQQRVRTAAEKEGISVEEWLQQRLYSNASRSRDETREQHAPPAEFPQVNVPSLSPQMRTSSPARGEAAPTSSARRIDETVHAMARLLEANERLQSNANRALAGLTSEIDAATREQAEAFETLKGRVDGLEHTIHTGQLRQDIDRLSQIQTRLSENTQNHLGAAEEKIDALVHRLTSLAGTIALTRDEVRHADIATAEKLGSVESRLQLTEASAARWPQIEAVIGDLSHRVSGIDQLQHNISELGRWHSETTSKIVALSQGLEEIVAGVAAIHEDTRRRETRMEEQLNLIAERLGSTELRLDSHDAKAVLVQSREGIVDEKLHSLSTRAEEVDLQHQNISTRVQTIEDVARGVVERVLAVDGQLQSAAQNLRALEGHTQGVDERILAMDGQLQSAAQNLRALEGHAQGVDERVLAMEEHLQSAAQNLQSTDHRVLTLEGLSQGVSESVQAMTTRLQAAETRLDAGDAKAMLALGLAHADGIGVARDETEASLWLDRAAEAGEAVAQFRLGTRYENGIGVSPSPEQAMRWYTEAARRGNARAMNNLGVAHANGIGVEKNIDEARNWFQAAAELGLADAQFNLGVMYERGLGFEASLAEAHKWYSAAAKSGDVYASLHAEALTQRMSDGNGDADDQSAAESDQENLPTGEDQPVESEPPQDDETNFDIAANAS